MPVENSLGDAKSRRDHLYQLLRSVPPSEGECAAYLPRLAAYIDLQLAGEDYLTHYPDVAMHLDQCLVCADTYARLYELEVALAAQSLPEAAAQRTPDLSFLYTPALKSPASLVDLLSRALRATAAQIRLQLSPDLLALLQPPQSAPLLRGAADDSRYAEVIYELTPEQVAETPLQLTAYRDAEQPDRCLLEVTVMPPGERWPHLGGRTVTLDMGSERMTALTDAWGVAAFLDVPIARLGEVVLEVGLAR